MTDEWDEYDEDDEDKVDFVKALGRFTEPGGEDILRRIPGHEDECVTRLRDAAPDLFEFVLDCLNDDCGRVSSDIKNRALALIAKVEGTDGGGQ